MLKPLAAILEALKESRNGKTDRYCALRWGDGCPYHRFDIAFFRDRFWERLMVNIGIVLVFAAFYMRFLGFDGRHL